MAETFYFSHDYNARADTKIKKLLAKQGYPGYGLFWAIIEDLYNNANALRLDYDSIAFDLRTSPEIIKSILHDFDLFVISDEKTFGSLSVQKRLNERNSKSKKARKSAQQRWKQSKSERNANALPTQSESNAIKERKGKENKGKEIKGKEKDKRVFSAPALSEFVEYFNSNGFKLDVAERAWKGYTEANWIDSQGNPVRNWKQKCQNVWFKPEHKKPETGKVVFVN